MDDRLPLRRPLTVVLLGMAGVFGLMGAWFITSPGPAAIFFGYPLAGPSDGFYVRAAGFRDIALSIYLVLLTLFGSRRALFLLLIGTPVIPIGDFLLLRVYSDWTGHELLHLWSAACFPVIALWVHKSRPLDTSHPD